VSSLKTKVRVIKIWAVVCLFMVGSLVSAESVAAYDNNSGQSPWIYYDNSGDVIINDGDHHGSNRIRNRNANTLPNSSVML